MDWAYQHCSIEEIRDERGRVYSENLDDYLPMCRSCHRALDIVATPEVRDALHRGGSKGIARVNERRKSEPEFAEYLRKVSRANGPLVASILHERRKSDPEFASRMLEASRKGGSTRARQIPERWRTDPEYAAKMTEVLRANGAEGRLTFSHRMETDSEFRARILSGLEKIRELGGEATRQKFKDPDFRAMMEPSRREGGRTVSRKRRSCLDCRKVLPPGPMGMHLRGSGHSGYEDVS